MPDINEWLCILQAANIITNEGVHIVNKSDLIDTPQINRMRALEIGLNGLGFQEI